MTKSSGCEDALALDLHTENSSQYNNCSSAEHLSGIHDEDARAQQVVPSTPTRIPMKSNSYLGIN